MNDDFTDASGDPAEPGSPESSSDHDHHHGDAHQLAETGRKALLMLWARRDQKALMELSERHLLGILEGHPQYRSCWEGAEPEPGTNPFMHVLYHEVIRKQVESAEPPEARETLFRLQAAGMPEHEAEHQLMEAFIRELVDMLTRRGPFDRQRYIGRLKALEG